MAAAYGWRVIVLLALAYVALSIIAELQFVAVCVFMGLIITALASPPMRLFRLVLPRPIALALSLILLVVVLLGVLVFITGSVAGQWDSLVAQFHQGANDIVNWLREGPFGIAGEDLTQWYGSAQTWLTENRGDLASRALGSAGVVVEGVAGLALSFFIAVCFLAGGDGIWAWIVRLFPARTRARIDGAGAVAWRAFAGYTRGIIIVAAANSVFVAILLLALQIPLAIPLALVVFFGTFIPMIGAPLAMLMATVVALGTRGPWYAVGVLIGIFLLGQIEGHVLHPVVMSRAVSIHPLAVGLSLAAGAIVAGMIGAVVAVPVVSVIYGVVKFWVQTAPREPDEVIEALDTGGAS